MDKHLTGGMQEHLKKVQLAIEQDGGGGEGI